MDSEPSKLVPWLTVSLSACVTQDPEQLGPQLRLLAPNTVDRNSKKNLACFSQNSKIGLVESLVMCAWS